MKEVIITPLGTVSPYTKNNMNCPGFLVKYNDKKILLDCGNGITRLLKFPEDLENLNVIITHYHKDHFADIGAVQYVSYVYNNLGILNNKVNVFLPLNEKDYNKESIISNKETYTKYFEIFDNLVLPMSEFKTTFKDNKSHNIKSYMIKLENKDFKIIYTSDIGTTNFTNLIEFCKNADLIICESSFLKKHNSNSKTHMTAYDAAVLAKKSKAKQLLLTHFWPEEDKKLYLEKTKEIFDNVEVAYEGKKFVLRRN